MMTIAFALIAVSTFFLWRRQSQWGWMVMLLVLCLGVVIFVGDVDFGSNLGIQL